MNTSKEQALAIGKQFAKNQTSRNWSVSCENFDSFLLGYETEKAKEQEKQESKTIIERVWPIRM